MHEKKVKKLIFPILVLAWVFVGVLILTLAFGFEAIPWGMRRFIVIPILANILFCIVVYAVTSRSLLSLYTEIYIYDKRLDRLEQLERKVARLEKKLREKE